MVRDVRCSAYTLILLQKEKHVFLGSRIPFREWLFFVPGTLCATRLNALKSPATIQAFQIAIFRDEAPKNVSRVPNKEVSPSLWLGRPWPSSSFKRMVTAVPQVPMACALPDEWLQQLFMHHEWSSNLTAAIAPCFKDSCGYSCKNVQIARPTVQQL